MKENTISGSECPNCLGHKSVFNGENYEVCPLCYGEGTYNENEDQMDIEFFPEDEDIIMFDENLHSLNDKEDE